MPARIARPIRRLAGAGVLLALPLQPAAVAPIDSARPVFGATGGREAATAPIAAPTMAPTTAPGGYAVGAVTLTLVDRRRTVRLQSGTAEPRTLVTYVRYPKLGGTTGAATAPAPGPFPLVVFAHGYDVTPATYARLLASWARAGYVVAAPLFPLTNAHAPGGPDEADVVNQPADVSFVISSLLAVSAGAGAGSTAGPLLGLIDARRVAVAGQSDGAETALAVADSRRDRDACVSAALIFSGAELSGIGGYGFPPGGPALLAAQGTDDSFNEPRYTYAYFRAAHRPKYLLRLLGAGHLPPYTSQQPQLAIVERVTRAFLDGYLKGSASARADIAPFGNVTGAAALVSEP